MKLHISVTLIYTHSYMDFCVNVQRGSEDIDVDVGVILKMCSNQLVRSRTTCNVLFALGKTNVHDLS